MQKSFFFQNCFEYPFMWIHVVVIIKIVRFFFCVCEEWFWKFDSFTFNRRVIATVLVLSVHMRERSSVSLSKVIHKYFIFVSLTNGIISWYLVQCVVLDIYEGYWFLYVLLSLPRSLWKVFVSSKNVFKNL